MKAKPPGRPRSEKARKAILDSAFELLRHGGVGSVTVEAVATKAGVGKPTIYRYWDNAHELAMAAIMAQSDGEPARVRGTDALGALQTQLAQVVARFSRPQGRQAAILMAASDGESELSKAFRNQVILQSREQGRELLQDAMASGEIRPDIALEAVLDMIYGPIFYRLLAGHAPLDEEVAGQIVATIRRAIST